MSDLQRYLCGAKRLLLATSVSIGLLASANQASADGANAACPDAGVFGTGMITNVCWSCIFPMYVSGIRMGGSSEDVPNGAADPKPLCLCQDANGVYRPGTQMSMWQPARLVESVRVPYCSPTLGGEMLQEDLTHIGTRGYGQDSSRQHKAFYQYHYFAYPLLVMLDLFLQPHCNPGGFSDMDLMYLSELDPTWNDDELAFYLNPESAIFASPGAIAACTADAAAASAGSPIKNMFWCAGAWGGIYPLTGHVLTNASPPRSAALVGTRALAALHRRGLALQTMGDDAMCANPIHPTMLKTQYKFQQLYPLPEANGNHWIGEPTYLWGEWRNIPSVGEDFVNLIWRYDDCCTQF